MILVNTFITSIILCLLKCNAEPLIAQKETDNGYFPKSTDDPRLIELQKKICWQSKFSNEITGGLKVFTSLMHQNILSDLGNEREYIVKQLKKKLEDYGKELSTVLKDNSSHPGISISVVEKHMPAINNYFDIRVRANNHFNVGKTDGLENEMKGKINVQHSIKQDQTPEVNKADELQATDPNLVKTLDKNIKEAFGSTLEQLKELNEQILRTEPSISKTADEEKKVECLSNNLASVLAKFENDCQDYLSNEFTYLKSNMTRRYETFNTQMDHIVRSKVSSLVQSDENFSSEFESDGQIRFYASQTSIDTKPESFNEKIFTSWYDFNSSGDINVQGTKKTLDTFLDDLYRSKKFSSDDFDQSYVYFESKGNLVFKTTLMEYFGVVSFGYISLSTYNLSEYNYKRWSTNGKNERETKYKFSSTGFLGFVVDDATKSIEIGSAVVCKDKDSDIIWYSFTSDGSIEIAC